MDPMVITARKVGERKLRCSDAPKARAPRKPRTAPEHPTYAIMINEAITQLKGKSGSSGPTILKYITQHYKLGDNVTMINGNLKRALTRGVAKGELKQLGGTGGTPSFKVVSDRAQKKTATPRVKKPVAKNATDEPKVGKKAVATKPNAEEKAKSPAIETVPKVKGKRTVKSKAVKSVKSVAKPTVTKT
ncbi:hypothetical protein RB195_016652 [Necator americanus]|uniref:H15 domain-containing protein n=1 Tax=Necator americanus TaxID=51031 RepID=A0ABR1C1G6_NECAM